MIRTAVSSFVLVFVLLILAGWGVAQAEDERDRSAAGPELAPAIVAQRLPTTVRSGSGPAPALRERPSQPVSQATRPADSLGTSPSELPLDDPELIALRQRVRQCLDHYYDRPTNVADHSPWGIMHALIAYGVDTEVLAGGQRVNAIGWLAWNQPCRGMRMMYTQDGQLRLRLGPGVQGHEGQFLAMLAQSRVRSDYVVKVDGQEFTVDDLIRYEQKTCRAGTELTFKLIALVHYLESDATWKNERGEDWDIPRLIKEELAQSVIGAACGGTHRMMGFSYAVRKRADRGEPFEGQWLRAQKFVDAYHEYTLKLQNPDGSFSCNWFESRGDWGGAPRKVQTTGHILEWLVYSLPQEQLTDPQVVKAVDFLTSTLWDGRGQNWEIGPRGHALHALVLYDQRVFGAKPGQRSTQVAQQPQSGN